MSVTAVVTDSNGDNIAETSSDVVGNVIPGNTYTGDLLGAFDASGGLRGVVGVTSPPFGVWSGQAQFLLVIAGESGDDGSTLSLIHI